MRIVLDTNVFISGVFFGGTPYKILKEWRRGKMSIVLSQEIYDEYQRVATELSDQFGGIDISAILELLTVTAIWVNAPMLSFSITDDPDDDIFFACAMASKTKIIVSGDKHLLDVSGFKGITVLTPREFVDIHTLSK